MKLGAAEVQRLIMEGFGAERQWLVIEALEPGYVRTRLPFQKWMRRPGNVISGPALFTAADTAMYALVLGHAGPQMMAVTSDINLHFVNRGAPADVITEVRLLKFGRKIAVMNVELRCGEDPKLIAHAVGSYSLPSSA